MKSLGLDFGTTNTVLAARDERSGAVAPFSFQYGEDPVEALRTALCFWKPSFKHPATTAVEAGPWAIQHYIDDPEDCRFMQSIKTFSASPYFNGTYVFGKRYRFEDLLEAFFARVHAHAGDALRALPKRIVVGRPVKFAGASPDALLAQQRYVAALSRFGFEDIIFVYEPVAAAFFFARSLKKAATVLVADFGGGTTDYSILRFEVADGVVRAQPLGHGGVGLAGDTFDCRIINNVILPHLGKDGSYQSMGKVLEIPRGVFTSFAQWNLLSVLKTSDEFRDLKRMLRSCLEPQKIERFIQIVEDDLGYPLYKAVSAAKARLSIAETTELNFPALGGDLHATIRRDDFEGWIADDLRRIELALDDTLASAGVGIAAIDRVFLTGGTSFVPAVRRIFENRFGADRIESGDELLSIANGLAMIGEREDARDWAARDILLSV